MAVQVVGFIAEKPLNWRPLKNWSKISRPTKSGTIFRSMIYAFNSLKEFLTWLSALLTVWASVICAWWRPWCLQWPWSRGRCPRLPGLPSTATLSSPNASDNQGHTGLWLGKWLYLTGGAGLCSRVVRDQYQGKKGVRFDFLNFYGVIKKRWTFSPSTAIYTAC